jgi:CheY-like chemotaxis protein
VRIAVCDDEVFMREMVEALVRTTGHEVMGIADTTPAAVGLIEAGRPDAVVVDPSMGVNTDFDVIEAAIAVRARAIVFSHHADAELLSQYSVPPAVVAKPDLDALEQVLLRLGRDDAGGGGVAEQDRRRRPAVVPEGPEPSGPSDAQAFFEAVNGARAGDALVGLDVPAGPEGAADEVGRQLRDTDRLLVVPPRAVRVFLPGGGEEGVASVLSRFRELRVAESWQVTSVIVREGEHGADAFDRLKHEGELHPL